MVKKTPLSFKVVSLFNKVYVDCGAPAWPGGLDMAPDGIYDEIRSKVMTGN